VRKAVSLPEPHNEEEHWFCNRLVNEALLAARQRGDGPVHINVPLTEPLYEFTVDSLPDERRITYAAPCVDKRLITECAGMFWKASRPMVVVGQSSKEKLIADDFAEISGFAVVLNEALSIGCGACHFDELLCQEQLPDDLVPDFLLYVGDTLVSRRMKQFLRKLPKDVPVWAISEDGAVHDTFKSLCGVIEGHPADAIASLGDLAPMKRRRGTSPFFDRWDELLAETDEKIEDFTPGYSQMAAVKCLEEMLDDDDDFVTHYANSMSVRLANIYACHYVFCNRGVNGIEGSLSTAAGFSLVTDQTVYCVLGDLSFFYNSNALWNEELRGNLRILLLNNGGGGIFEKFEGLQGSPARERFVMAKHHASAEGICQSYQVAYRAAHNMDELEEGIYWLQQEQGERPMLLEVFTDSANDAKIMKAYYDRFRG
jgi:2-succinyl-5-enolpyruvyl-6-hydroxy-3-cyclohexene-1-carboxylate synthase